MNAVDFHHAPDNAPSVHELGPCSFIRRRCVQIEYGLTVRVAFVLYRRRKWLFGAFGEKLLADELGCEKMQRNG
jgi:hypothetical protein